MKKNKVMIIILLILISLIALVGSSYALLTKSFKSSELSMEIGTLKVDFAEGNAINMTNSAPMTDTEGMNTIPYTFTITNTGNIDAYYTVSNEEELANTLDNSYLHMRLVGSDGYDSGIKKVSDLGTETYKVVNETSLASLKSVTYKLYMWISSDANNSIQDKMYKSKIVVNVTSNKTEYTVAEKLLTGVGKYGSIDKSDSEQTFITGTNPNNYIWYSGNLWRAVSIDTVDNSVKLVTDSNISSISYNSSGNTSFQNSYMEQWLNDTSVDGFLGNLREVDKFIKKDSVLNATIVANMSDNPEKTTMLVAPVGLLNVYEYVKTGKNVGYLDINSNWGVLTPNSSSEIYYTDETGSIKYQDVDLPTGIRPVINLQSNIKISSGTGTKNAPYRLEGDNDETLAGTLLSTRYSGEYIKFGTDSNQLYQIVSHENGIGTKIVSSNKLYDKESNGYLKIAFGSLTLFSKNNTIGSFLNNDFLIASNYLENDSINMIEDNSTWYLGTVNNGDSYKLAKYTDISSTSFTNNTTAKIGLLRLGELLTGQSGSEDMSHWLLTPTATGLAVIGNYGSLSSLASSDTFYVRPAMNLKANVVITGGDGTKNNPFTVKLGS